MTRSSVRRRSVRAAIGLVVLCAFALAATMTAALRVSSALENELRLVVHGSAIAADAAVARGLALAKPPSLGRALPRHAATPDPSLALHAFLAPEPAASIAAAVASACTPPLDRDARPARLEAHLERSRGPPPRA